MPIRVPVFGYVPPEKYAHLGISEEEFMAMQDRGRAGTATRTDKALLREASMLGNNNIFSMQNLLIFAVVARLSKTPEGLKVLRDIAVQAIKTVGDTCEALAKASVGNPVAAWANPYLLSIIFERFSLVPSERMMEFRIGLSLVSGVEVLEDVAVALGSIFHIIGGRSPPSEFPSHINFGDKTYAITPSLSLKQVKEPKKTKK